MYHKALIFLACILAGFALIYIPTNAVITGAVALLFDVIGVIAIIVFSFALLYYGGKVLFKKG
ncbi:hypothetical protein ACFYKX_01410 [Cytobacillus sp. FJAT-54145]|uniref:DUF1328 domain-containing protein n=1 Tax=Cytobacillus spartinae TaxID=3299023 RepID=A0ABW6K979_9BACI